MLICASKTDREIEIHFHSLDVSICVLRHVQMDNVCSWVCWGGLLSETLDALSLSLSLSPPLYLQISPPLSVSLSLSLSLFFSPPRSHSIRFSQHTHHSLISSTRARGSETVEVTGEQQHHWQTSPSLGQRGRKRERGGERRSGKSEEKRKEREREENREK